MKKISVVIPVHNEHATISQIIDKVKRVPMSGIEKEIIVVDDCSTDGTRDVLKQISGIKVLIHEKNLGKGGAMKTGFKNASGDILIPQDADLEYDPNDLPALIAPILRGESQVTNGVRLQPKNDHRRLSPSYWAHWAGNNAITWLTNILFLHYSKEYEGCYKAFTREIIDSIHVDTNNFDFDNELICKILKKCHKVIDVPIRYYPRGYEEGKKINWRHGFLILWTIFKTRFTD